MYNTPYVSLMSLSSLLIDLAVNLDQNILKLIQEMSKYLFRANYAT